MNKKETNIWKAVALIAIAMLAVVGVLYVNNIGLNKPVEEESVPEEEISYLSLWNDDAKAKIELEKYIKEVTDETSPSYIPEENRIAVFDLDGTLFCETDPSISTTCCSCTGCRTIQRMKRANSNWKLQKKFRNSSIPVTIRKDWTICTDRVSLRLLRE